MTLDGAGVHLVCLKRSLGYGSVALRCGETQEQPPLSEWFGLEVLPSLLPSLFFNVPIVHWAHGRAELARGGPDVQLPEPSLYPDSRHSISGWESRAHILKAAESCVGEASGRSLQYGSWSSPAHS